MKWLKIGTAISLLILFTWGTGWRTGCPTGDGEGLKSGAIIDSLDAAAFSNAAQGNYTQYGIKSGNDYKVLIDMNNITSFLILNLPWIHIYDTYEIDSITYWLRCTGSGADSLCVVFGLARQKIADVDPWEYERYEYDDLFCYNAGTANFYHTTVIDSTTAGDWWVHPLIDVVQRDASLSFMIMAAFIHATVD